MFFLLSKILDVLLSPLTWALLLMLAAVPWRRRGATSPRLARRRRTAGVLALVVLCVFSLEPVASVLFGVLENQAEKTFDPRVTYDAVVLLGGAVDSTTATHGERAFNDNVDRLLGTYHLLEENHARVAILSGAWVHPDFEEPTEAAALRDELVSLGIAEDRLIVEPRARNTRENAVYVAEIVRARHFERVLVVTSAFHMARSLDCFRAVGLRVDSLPVDYRMEFGAPTGGWLPRAKALEVSTAAIREITGRWIYRLRGFGRGP